MQLEFKGVGWEPILLDINWRTDYKIRGNYNIVDNKLNFIEAPNGKNPIGTATNPPNERDFTGITTSASFNGRVFMRSGVVGGSEELMLIIISTMIFRNIYWLSEISH